MTICLMHARPNLCMPAILMLRLYRAAMVMVDTAGRMVLVNNTACRLFGYPQEELLGQLIELLVPERYRERHVALRKGFTDDPEPMPRHMGKNLQLSGRGHLYGRKKDGSEFPIEAGLNPLRQQDGSLFVLAAVVDISERVAAEQRIRMVVDTSPSGMVVINERGSVVMVNKTACSLFGYTEEEMLAQVGIHNGHAVTVCMGMRARVDVAWQLLLQLRQIVDVRLHCDV